MVKRAVVLASRTLSHLQRSSTLGRLPVALAPIANRPLLAHALDSLKETGVSEVAVLVEPSIAQEVRRALHEAQAPGGGWDFDLLEVEDRSSGSLAGSLAAVRGFVGEEPFALHLGDSVSRCSLTGVVGSTTLGEFDALLVTHDGGTGVPPAVTDLASQRLARHPSAVRPRTVPAGVYVFGQRIFDVVGVVDRHSTDALALIASVEQLSELGGHVETRRVTGWWRYGDRPDALLEGNRFALEGLLGDTADAQLVDTRIEGEAMIHPTARLESTVVRGPVKIGARVRITNSYVGPYTSVGDDVVIEGAEVENSVIFAGASLKHLGTRLEASVVGAGAKVGRDFRLPKALRLTIGEGATISLS